MVMERAIRNEDEAFRIVSGLCRTAGLPVKASCVQEFCAAKRQAFREALSSFGEEVNRQYRRETYHGDS